MADLDLVIRNATVATAADVFRADIGVAGGRGEFLRCDLPPAVQARMPAALPEGGA